MMHDCVIIVYVHGGPPTCVHMLFDSQFIEFVCVFVCSTCASHAAEHLFDREQSLSDSLNLTQGVLFASKD